MKLPFGYSIIHTDTLEIYKGIFKGARARMLERVGKEPARKHPGVRVEFITHREQIQTKEDAPLDSENTKARMKAAAELDLKFKQPTLPPKWGWRFK